MITAGESDNRRLAAIILGILLAVMFLCIVSEKQMIELPVKEGGAIKAGVSGSMADDWKMIPGMSGERRTDKEFECFAENKRSRLIERPELPEAGVRRRQPIDEAAEVLLPVGWNMEKALPHSMDTAEETFHSASDSEPSAVPPVSGSFTVKDQLVFVDSESGTISGEADFISNARTFILDLRGNLSEDEDKENQTVPAGDEEQIRPITLPDDEGQIKPIVSTDNEGQTKPVVSVDGEDQGKQNNSSDGAQDTEQNVPSGDVGETDRTASSDDVENTDRIQLCSGFLVDASGMIIGCQGVSITDGVLCLPSDAKCTGVAAGVLDSLGAEVYEMYIPANIVSIEEGALDGLTELFFVQVHPNNPVYGSEEGYLYKK